MRLKTRKRRKTKILETQPGLSPLTAQSETNTYLPSRSSRLWQIFRMQMASNENASTPPEYYFFLPGHLPDCRNLNQATTDAGKQLQLGAMDAHGPQSRPQRESSLPQGGTDPLLGIESPSTKSLLKVPPLLNSALLGTNPQREFPWEQTLVQP